MLRAADARVFISETVRHDLLGDPPRLTSELLFNGVDATIFRVEASGSPKATDGVPLIGAKRRVLFVGRYVQKKGLAVLRQLAKLRPEIEFVLAGAGPMTPKDWGLHNVHDLGLQTREDLAELYRRADLLILPSVGEGYPLVIQEAMACGLPVVCGTPADRADPGASSWLRGVDVDLSRPDESAQRCADAIDDFRLSSEERAKMARYAVRQYDWPKMAQRLITLASAP
jgi:glycosyltransferase involved in cell wall biosynthesis